MKLKPYEALLLGLALGLFLFTAGFLAGRLTAKNRIQISSVPTNRVLVSPPGEAFEEDKRLSALDLNTASEQELTDLPGIGPELAKAIITYREEHEGFTVPSELLNISGIGLATYEKLEPLVTVNTVWAWEGENP